MQQMPGGGVSLLHDGDVEHPGTGRRSPNPLRVPLGRRVAHSHARGEKESPVRKLMLVSVVLALAWAATSEAGQRTPPVSGAFVSATLDGAVIKWELDLGGDAGKKTYEMTVDVQVTYAEKEGVKEGQRIRQAGGPDRPAREGTVAVKGKFVSAKLDGEKVMVTIKPAEGDKDLEVVLPKKLSVYAREQEGKLTAFSIGIPRPPRPPAQ